METCYSDVVRRWVLTLLDFCFWFGGKFFNYPTLIFYQMSYELAVLWQASRRHYRLIQTEECRTYYIACENTLQAAAVEIMAEKQVAASAIQGKFSAEGLTAMAKGVDSRLRLAQKMASSDNSNRSTLSNMFDAINASNNSTDDENRYKGFKEASTYYEIIGISPSEEDTIEEELSIFSEFTFGEGQQTETVIQTEPVLVEPLVAKAGEEETDPFGLDSIFDFFGGLSMEATVVNPELLALEETDKKPKKAKKDKKLADGQLSFFDLMSA